MTHRLVLTREGSSRTMDFRIEKEGRNGWAELKLFRIDDCPPNPGVPSPEYYDPAIHDGKSHSMSGTWRARGFTQNNVRMYTLIGPFGDPGSRITLEPILETTMP